MTTSVTFPVELGGSGRTYSDGNDPVTGFGNDGHRIQLMPMMEDSVAIAAQGKLNMEAAQAAAQTAVNAPGTMATSTTSLLIGLGSKTLGIQTGKTLGQGSYVTIASVADETNAMFGPVAAYNAGTGALEVTAQYKTGAGTFADWTISVCGPALDLSDDTPQPLGVASPGNSGQPARANHVHAHGDQAGGSLHANASAGGAGFMSVASFNKAEAAIPNTYLDTDTALTANSDAKIATQKAVKAYSMPLAYLDIDGALAANSDVKVASQKATKTYIDGLALNLGKRQRVRVKSTANLTIATALNAGDVLNGVTLAAGDLVLLNDQTTTSQNGVYVVGPSPARAAEFDAWSEFPGSLITVAEGTVDADTVWLCTSNDGGTLGSTAISFSKTSATGALLAANNLSDLGNAGTARTNLGGTGAGQNLFTLANPSAIRYLRINADNSVTALTAAQLRTDLAVVPGTDVLAYDLDVQQFGALARTQGDIVFGSASQWQRLPAAASGRFLRTNGAGADPSWEVVPIAATLVKPADQARASTATLAVDDFLVFAMEANATYQIVLNIVGSCGAGDFKWGLAGPASPVSVFGNYLWLADGASASRAQCAGMTGYLNSVTFAAPPTTNAKFHVQINLRVVNGPNAGNFQLNWAQATSNATFTRVETGSSLEYRKD